jgi:hypothetical protein
VTHTELVLLLSGIAIGFDLAVAMHFGYEILDVRRERRRRQAEDASVALKATQASELTGSRKPPAVQLPAAVTIDVTGHAGTERRV